jgi:hypothetical protein
MTVEECENALRQLIRRKPFQPFVVELLDGNLIEVNQPGMAFGGGGAAFISPDDVLVDFQCDNVWAIRKAARETAP